MDTTKCDSLTACLLNLKRFSSYGYFIHCCHCYTFQLHPLTSHVVKS